jgi:hypothetical protein
MERGWKLLALVIALTACDDKKVAPATTTSSGAAAPATAPAADAAAANVDVCALLTKDEVEAVIGKLDEPPKVAMGPDDHGDCEWNAHLDGKISGLTVTLFDPKSTAASWPTARPVDVPGAKRAVTTAATSLTSGGNLLVELANPPYVVHVMVMVVNAGGTARSDVDKELGLATLLVGRIAKP